MRMFGLGGEEITSTPPVINASQPSEPSNPSNLPDWALSLLSKPSISTRKGIERGFFGAKEDSSVLVLTAPSGRYVDIRFALTGDDPCSPSNPAFWAFAGISTMEISGAKKDGRIDGGFECTAHGKWEHPIDSSRDFDAIDEGDMFLLQNGDVMEIGTTENPETGKVQLYKEYWTSPSPKPRTMRPCVVAEIKGTIAGAGADGKGMIVRIGDYVQGIFQTEEQSGEFWVERWLRSTDRQAEGWIKDDRSNTTEELIPIIWATGEMRKLGDKITCKERNWEVVEVMN